MRLWCKKTCWFVQRCVNGLFPGRINHKTANKTPWRQGRVVWCGGSQGKRGYNARRSIIQKRATVPRSRRSSLDLWAGGLWAAAAHELMTIRSKFTSKETKHGKKERKWSWCICKCAQRLLLLSFAHFKLFKIIFPVTPTYDKILFVIWLFNYISYWMTELFI